MPQGPSCLVKALVPNLFTETLNQLTTLCHIVVAYFYFNKILILPSDTPQVSFSLLVNYVTSPQINLVSPWWIWTLIYAVNKEIVCV